MSPLDHELIAARIRIAMGSAAAGVVMAAGFVVQMLTDDWRSWLGFAFLVLGFLVTRRCERLWGDLDEAIEEAQQ